MNPQAPRGPFLHVSNSTDKLKVRQTRIRSVKGTGIMVEKSKGPKNHRMPELVETSVVTSVQALVT